MVEIVGAACGGGVLLGLVFASEGSGPLAWIALVPWLVALRRLAPPSAFAFGWIGGLLAALVTFGWLANVPAFGVAQFAVLGGYVALYAAFWCAGLAVLSRHRRAWLLYAPALWVALDMVRHHAGFLSLPIASLGQSQHADIALLQLAAVGGESAITWIVVLGNVAIEAALTQRRWRTLGIGAAAIATAHAAGAIALSRADGGPPPLADSIKVAAVQPDIGLHERDTVAGREGVWRRLANLTRAVAHTRPALIVWPETAVGDPRHDAALAQRLVELSRQVGAPLVIGSSETEKLVDDGPERLTVRERDAYNAAYLVRGDVPLGEPYRKRRLLPFGEYTPLPGWWPTWLVTERATAIAGESEADFVVDSGATPAASSPGLRLGVVICWENLFADLSRDAVRHGAGLLVQLTNDAWFGPGRAALQHNAASMLRAVENGVPLVLASNAGPSLLIDAHGRILQRTPTAFVPGVIVASLAPGATTTPFNRFGEWFAVVCCAVGLAGLFPRRLLPTALHPFPCGNAVVVKETP